MPQQQQFVSNVAISVAANLRFKDDNGLPVTEMLPIGMNGTIVADNPRTGYISRIGAVLSEQIDLYNKVSATLDSYNNRISDLEEAVAALEISGTTMPSVNGACFNNNEPILIQDAVQLIIDSACEFYPVMGTVSDLMEAILAEGASTLNLMPSFSVSGAKMQALQGWISDPKTVADTITNLWLSYLDSRAGVTAALALAMPSCSQNIIDFQVVYGNVGGNNGFSLFFSGYTFLPSAYTDNGSTFTITDGLGGIYTTGLDIVSASQPGADPIFVGISGTALDPTAACYSVNVNSVVIAGSNSCTKNVIHSTCDAGTKGSSYKTGTFSTGAFSGPVVVANAMPFIASYADVTANASTETATILASGYSISIDGVTGDITLTTVAGSGAGLNLRWIAYK